ncbi:MAG: chemotaxis protein [Caulobacter sp.]|nr:chemotaxis protein [Caulobacter sp.]
MRAFDRLTIAWKLVGVAGLALGLLAGGAAAVAKIVGFPGLTPLLLAGGGAAILAGLIVLMTAAAVVRRPLAGLTRSVTHLGAGRYDQPVAGTDGGDEIAALARALDGVRHDLAQDKKTRAAQDAERLAAEAALRQQVETAEALAAAQAAEAALLARSLEKLADGDLIARLDEDRFAPEARQAPRDFNAAVERLQASLAGVLATTRTLRDGCAEIGEAADALSHRTERQGVGLAQTAAALTEVTATVKRSAEGAQRARQVTHSARANAETSGQVVREAIEAMGGIEHSSREITQIIGVIDEIAFQTNLLALNAGVEAARAGDAGRGFAVVAQEVRALAQRSADAAKQIKGLISTSTRQVDKGVKLVGQTGETLDQILGQVAELDGLVDEIAASAQTQAEGLAQVNVAMNRLEQGNQRTAAMAEQSAAASQALAVTAVELERLAGGFQVTAQVHEYRPRLAEAVPAVPQQLDAFRQRYVQGATALKIEPSARPGR